MDNSSGSNVEEDLATSDQRLLFDRSFQQCSHYWHLGPGELLEYFKDLGVGFTSYWDFRFWKLDTFEIVWMLLNYVIAVKWTYNYLMGKCTFSRDHMGQRKAEIAELEAQMEMLELKIQRRRPECVEKAAEMKLKVNRFIKLRARVRELLATDAMRSLLKHVVIWNDISMNGGGDDLNGSMMVEMLRKLNYEQSILPHNATRIPYHQNEENVHSVSSQSSGDARPQEKESLKLVKVTNIYKLGLRHQSRHVKVKSWETGSLQKKKTETIKKVLQEWQASLNSVVEKKLSERKLVPSQRELDATTNHVEDDNITEDLETDNLIEVNNDETGASDLRYGPKWSQYGCQLMAYDTEEPTELLDMNNMMYGPTQCECNGPQGSNLLFILPEETRSQIEISEIEQRKDDDCDFDLLY